MKKPNFFIIGAPKCGTTSLYVWLSQHPNVYMPKIKEPHFFSSDLRVNKVYSLSDYERLFSKANSNHIAIGEASTLYLFSEQAVPNIERTYPKSRYIAMIRNPIEMAYASHQQAVWNGSEHIRDFEIAWRLSPERRQGREVTRWCREPRTLDYMKRCSLGEQLERLFSIVPRHRVLVLVLDDIREDPRREYLKALAFLGLSDDGRTEFPRVNPAKEPRYLVLNRLMRIGGESWRFVKRSLRIPSHIGVGVLQPLYRMNARIVPRPPLPDALFQELCAFFRPEIEKLCKLLERDFSYWLSL